MRAGRPDDGAATAEDGGSAEDHGGYDLQRRVLEVKGEKFLSHDFVPGGKAKFHRKDLGIALAAGREHGAALPATAVVDQMFGVLVAKGRDGWDHSALLTLFKEWSGHSGS